MEGDYINLGAGAEMGIYQKWVDVNGSEIYKVDKSLALPMTLTLYYKGKMIIQYKPSEKQWWITGFNPEYKDKNVDDLRAVYTIDFSSNTDMYGAFVKSKGYLENKDSWSVSEDNKYKLTFTFD